MKTFSQRITDAENTARYGSVTEGLSDLETELKDLRAEHCELCGASKDKSWKVCEGCRWK